MRIARNEPPRTFRVGREGRVTMADVAAIRLEADEQVTFVTDAGGEYDVARKSWGFYATPSMNHRLKGFGLRAALATNGARHYLLLVEAGREADFEAYCRDEGLRVAAWLDGDALPVSEGAR